MDILLIIKQTTQPQIEYKIILDNNRKELFQMKLKNLNNNKNLYKFKMFK